MEARSLLENGLEAGIEHGDQAMMDQFRVSLCIERALDGDVEGVQQARPAAQHQQSVMQTLASHTAQVAAIIRADRCGASRSEGRALLDASQAD